MFLHSLLEGWTWYPTMFDTPLNAVRSVAIWLTLTLVIAYLVCYYLTTERVTLSDTPAEHKKNSLKDQTKLPEIKNKYD